MQVAIASGKGGTGKTTLASNLAWTASELGHAVTYLDCDVEEPNGHLFLRPERIVEQSMSRISSFTQMAAMSLAPVTSGRGRAEYEGRGEVDRCPFQREF